jgi:hypothetical protein
VLLGELMPTIPAHHQFTEFRFRWPWLHNTGYAGVGSPPSGRPVQGGHLSGSSAMPGRNTGAS